MRLLLGVDGNDDSLRALERTVERVATTGDDLTVAVFSTPSSDRSPEAVERRVRTVLEDVDVDAPVRRLDGDPGSRLVTVAESEEFDRIVVGGGETSPMGKIDIGSVAEFVLLNATTSVTLVR